MHKLIVDEIISICRRREREGDFPGIEAPSVETLEQCILQLAEDLEKANETIKSLR